MHSYIELIISADGSVMNRDNGRGVPVGKQKQTGKDALEVVHTVLHAGGKFGGGGYKVSGGLHGVGVSVVNALSEWLHVEICSRRQDLAPGILARQADEHRQGDRSGQRSNAARTPFMPDAQVFETLDCSFDTISQRLRESAYLNKGVWIQFVDVRSTPPHESRSTSRAACVSFVRHLNNGRDVLHPRPIYVEKRDGTTQIEVALQYNDGTRESVFAFANNINTVDGGTHVTGFRAALTSSLNDYARKNVILKDNDANLSGDDVREGLTAVISVKLTDPQFEGQTKAKLGNAEVKGAVQAAVTEGVNQYLEENPQDAPPDHREVTDRGSRPRSRAQGTRPRHPQERARGHRHCPASWPTARNGTQRAASCSSSRATRPAARPSRAATATSRPFCPCSARCSTSRRRASTRCSRARRSGR